MNNFNVFKSSVDVNLGAFIACRAEYNRRFVPIAYGYPGITVEDTNTIDDVYNILTPFLPDGLSYDRGAGTGVNYVVSDSGIQWHADKPLYEYDEQFQLKPQFANRVCVGTVCVCIANTADIIIRNVDGSESTVSMSPGDVLTIERDIEHRLLASPAYASFVCLFVCSSE